MEHSIQLFNYEGHKIDFDLYENEAFYLLTIKPTNDETH